MTIGNGPQVRNLMLGVGRINYFLQEDTMPTSENSEYVILIWNPDYAASEAYLIDFSSPVVGDVQIVSGRYMNSDDFSEDQETAFNRVNVWTVSEDGKKAKINFPPINVHVKELHIIGWTD
jgi:hypothetical protein